MSIFRTTYPFGLTRSIFGRLYRGLLSPAFWENTCLALDEQRPILEWPVNGKVSENWGDRLNPALVHLLSGQKPVPRSQVWNISFRSVHYMIGSGLGGVVDPNAVIYGTGFLKYSQKPKVLPRNIVSVRGPLSSQKYEEAGWPTSIPFGDMALVLPHFYRPREYKARYEIGIIPHFREFNSDAWAYLRRSSNAKFIDICSPIVEVVEQISTCKVIASSSLHGLIAADAYGIPSVWVRASDSPRGDYFKFHDYLMSVNKYVEKPVRITEHVRAVDLINKASEASCPLDINELIERSPFSGSIVDDSNVILSILERY